MTIARSFIDWLWAFAKHLQFGAGGHLLRNSAGHLANECAASCVACPSDCSACTETTITLGGFSTACNITWLNGLVLTITKSGCTWSGSHNTIDYTLTFTLSCSSDYWNLSISGCIDDSGGGGPCFDFMTISGSLCNTDGCPGGVYDVVASGFFGNDSGTATIT